MSANLLVRQGSLGGLHDLDLDQQGEGGCSLSCASVGGCSLQGSLSGSPLFPKSMLSKSSSFAGWDTIL